MLCDVIAHHRRYHSVAEDILLPFVRIGRCIGSLSGKAKLNVVFIFQDTLFWIFIFIGTRARVAPLFFPAFALLPKEGWILTAQQFGEFYFAYIQFGTTLALTLNRFSVVVMPAAYDEVSTSHRLLHQH